MPMSHTYDSEQNLVLVKGHGVITIKDVHAHTRGIIDNDAVRSGFIEVGDFEEVEDLIITYSDLSPFRDIWQEYMAKGCRGVLVYTPTNVSYGIIRMFQTVIGANEIEGGTIFSPVRSREELEAKISELI